jgi:hypothetical protein
MKRFQFRLFLAAALLLLLPSSFVAAQAWVNPKGELSLALRSDYQTSSGVWHGSSLITGLPVTALNDSLEAEYIPVDHLGIGLTLAGDGVRYTGPQANPNNPNVVYAHGPSDDGSFHWNITDLELNARYQVYDGAVTLTPILRTRFPLTHYPTQGYAAAGSHLAEAGAGFYLGKYGLGLEDLVLQASYVFTYVDKESEGGAATEQFRVNRSDADLSLSYVINEKFIAGLGAALRITHDGYDLSNLDKQPLDPMLKLWHDPVALARYLAPTAVASYQFTPAWSLAARFAIVAWGENVSNAISFGLTLGWQSNLVE